MINTAIFEFRDKKYGVNFDRPLDISLPLKAGIETVNCFYAPPVQIEPVKTGDFIGSTRAGGPVNFMNVTLNPHGNGTHTECVGHISKEPFFINDCLTRFLFFAKLVSLYPTRQPDGDRIIDEQQLKEAVTPNETEALIIRTLPNDDAKRTRHYSGTNPPYLHHKGVEHLVACGVEHLLVDLPSVDREEDGGKLLSHKTWWNYPPNQYPALRQSATITELVYIPDEIPDGYYLLNLQVCPLELDAAPSKPVIYPILEVNALP